MPNRLTALVLALLPVACGGEPGAEVDSTSGGPTATLPSLPASIVAERGGFIPEGIEYDTSNGRILTGSLTEGSILQIHPDGRVTDVVQDPELISSIGIEVDEPRNRLLVANSDRAVFEGGVRGQAKLGVYDLTTGDRIAMVDLAASIEDAPADIAHFANDVAVAEDGNIYVTDSRADVIYRVDGDYRASVFHRPDGTGLSFNGIVAHPDGYLLVAGGTTLWKVPLDDPTGAAPVQLPEEIPGQDGMVWTADGRLAIVSNSSNRVVALRSSDGWATADLAGTARYEPQATTAAVVGDQVYVVHPHFADTDPPSISRVTFE
jgi:sugar lactone lactonase YvrE